MMMLTLSGDTSFLNALELPRRLAYFGYKPNPTLGMGDVGILHVMTLLKALPWSLIYALFGSDGVDGCSLIFEIISNSHC
jgi:hypothetical protein